MSSEYERLEARAVCGRKSIATRGLNCNGNRSLKDVFIGTATGGMQTEPWKSCLERLAEHGMRWEMARLTVARKIAAIG